MHIILEMHNRKVKDAGNLLVHFHNKTDYLLRNTWGMKMSKYLDNMSILVKLHFQFSLYINIIFSWLSSWLKLIFAKGEFLFPREPMLKKIISFQGLIKDTLNTCCVNLKRCAMLSLNHTKSTISNVIAKLLESLYQFKIAWQPTATVAIHKGSIC